MTFSNILTLVSFYFNIIIVIDKMSHAAFVVNSSDSCTVEVKQRIKLTRENKGKSELKNFQIFKASIHAQEFYKKVYGSVSFETQYDPYVSLFFKLVFLLCSSLLYFFRLYASSKRWYFRRLKYFDKSSDHVPQICIFSLQRHK